MTGRPGTREKEIGFERYPSFQKRDAHALRFGSMNSIARLLVHGVFFRFDNYADSERVVVFLRPANYGDSEAYFRIVKASLLWGNTWKYGNG